MNYSFTLEKLSHGPGYWDGILYTIYGDGVECGTLYRNYGGMAEPVFFQQNGVDYMLCSPHYTATSVYRLPDFVIQAEEPPSSFGFCPVEFLVPSADEDGFDGERGQLNGQFALMSGCVWGDDSSWKLEILDLTKLDLGIIRRCVPSYIELPPGKLKDAFHGWWWDNDGTFKAMVIQANTVTVSPKVLEE